ncbi:c-type cytochrome [Arcobacter sp. CECT 8985]|uniref:c-type cytochrome n=1 Tax=Arcobacter sp. CECT 8985 TaxID=1935424 RepID=UPI00100B24D5|nr:c-type cytochrome [Arcobacter sp. CECT 8985]RXJ86113.1 cytochrome C [Arcobacter sp. CECT 8985]
MKKIVIGTIIAAASLMAANFAQCASCHGAKAEKHALGKSHIIAGWPVDKIKEALHGYKNGTYGGAMKGVMKGQVARLSDADIDQLAKKISSFK